MSLSGNRKKLLQYSLAQIEDCIRNEEFGRALAHFCVVFKLQPTAKDELKEAFLLAVGKHTAYLESREKWKELFDCYEELLKAYYTCEELHHSLGSLLFRHGHVKEAASSIRKALEINPNFTAARLSLDGLRTSLLERWHFQMLNDRSRNEAFRDAVAAAVARGHRKVLDIGAGTGLLSLFALSAGADKVYSCEVSPTSSEMARAIFEENGFGAEARIINKLSTELVIPRDLDERVSLVITETFDSGLFGEHVLKSLAHAWDCLLEQQPQGAQPEVIPGKAEVFACLIESEWIRLGRRVSDHLVKDTLKLQECDLVSEESDEDPYTTERLSRIKHGYRCLSEPLSLISVNFNDRQDVQRLVDGVEWTEEVCCSPGVKVDAGDVVQLHMVCKGHLSISYSTKQPSGLTLSPAQTVRLPSDTVRALNGQLRSSAMLAEEMLSSGLSQTCNVLDLSQVPVLGLMLVRAAASRRLTWMPNQDSKAFVSAFVKAHELEGSVSTATELDTLCKEEGGKYDVLIINAFESCGLLRHGVLEDVALLRKSCLTPTAIIVPCTIMVRAVLVESQTLEEQSRLVSNDRTLSYAVADSINVFEVRTQQDVNLSSLPHRQLTDVFTLFEINLSDVGLDLPVISAVRAVPVTQSGRASGFCYWFDAECQGGHVISSYCKEGTTSQAAVLLRDPHSVQPGTCLKVVGSCTDSTIDIGLDSVKATEAEH
ncbi:protein arginine N-methyltransferase 9 [Ixodes scapularis]